MDSFRRAASLGAADFGVWSLGERTRLLALVPEARAIAFATVAADLSPADAARVLVSFETTTDVIDVVWPTGMPPAVGAAWSEEQRRLLLAMPEAERGPRLLKVASRMAPDACAAVLVSFTDPFDLENSTSLVWAEKIWPSGMPDAVHRRFNVALEVQRRAALPELKRRAALLEVERAQEAARQQAQLKAQQEAARQQAAVLDAQRAAARLEAERRPDIKAQVEAVQREAFRRVSGTAVPGTTIRAEAVPPPPAHATLVRTAAAVTPPVTDPARIMETPEGRPWWLPDADVVCFYVRVLLAYPGRIVAALLILALGLALLL